MCGVNTSKLYTTIEQVTSSTELSDYIGLVESLFREDSNKQCFELLQLIGKDSLTFY